MPYIPPNGSELEGFEKFSKERFTSGDPLDVALVRDGLAQNLESLYNGSFQVRVNDIPPSPTTYLVPEYGDQGTFVYFDPFTEWWIPNLINVFENFGTPEFPPALVYMKSYQNIPVTILKNGDMAPLYLELAACCSGPGKAVLNVVVRRQNESRTNPGRGEEEGIFMHGYTSLSGTVAQWHNLTIPDHGMLSLPERDLEPRPVFHTRMSEDSTEYDVSVDGNFVRLDLFMAAERDETGAPGIEFHGIYARENPWRFRG